MQAHQHPSRPTEAGRLLDTPALAAWLGLTERQIKWLVQQGQIPVTRIGRRVLFDMVEIDKWLSRNTERAA
jgi:excisionase family DNA binding protein